MGFALRAFCIKLRAEFVELLSRFCEALESQCVLAAPDQTLAVLEDGHGCLVGRVHRTEDLFDLLEKSLAARRIAAARNECRHVLLNERVQIWIRKLLQLFLSDLCPILRRHPLVAATIALGHQDGGLASKPLIFNLARKFACVARVS